MIAFPPIDRRRIPNHSERVLHEARRRLEANDLFRGRSDLIRIEEADGKLVLEGRLPTYYLKQMLQTVLRDVVGVRHIENRVTVDWPTEQRQHKQ